MSAVVIWRPERLNARLFGAAVPARNSWAAAARSKCSSSRVGASIRVLGETVAALHALAPIIEHGARPHTIEPGKKKALKFADGGFATVVEHPGSPAKPFLAPTLPLWPILYRKAASGAFRGF